jgi:polyvinyl alcohol dehydrogenase (cytochrome)
MRIWQSLLLLTCTFTTLPLLAAQCTFPPAPAVDANSWVGWGNGADNSRHSGEGLNSADLNSLQLQWTFAFPGVSSVVGNPVVLGNVIYIGVDSGQVYALDADSACVHWVLQADAGVRTAPAFAQLNGQPTLFFGDRRAQVYAVDAITGAQRWKVKVEDHAAAILTGSPQFVMLAGETNPARLIVPVSSSEEGLAAVPTYACCSFRGSVVSLDAATGAQLWKTHTIQSPVRDTASGGKGPSGGAIWSAPTVDITAKRLYVTTGDAYSAPADIATDAVMGLDLVTGNILWINQGTADDVWTVVCMTPKASDDCGPDQDYGSPAMLVADGEKQFLVAGQKSGWIRAFSLTGGSLLWNTALVENTEEFGGKVVWGGASDGRNAYFGLGSGGIAAVRLGDGEKQWFTELSPAEAMAAHPGQDGPLTVSADLLISGGWDGMLRILSTKNGELLWEFNTAQAFQPVNEGPGKGGSLGAAGPVVAGKRLLVPSGYVGVKNGVPGNVLLMFTKQQ